MPAGDEILAEELRGLMEIDFNVELTGISISEIDNLGADNLPPCLDRLFHLFEIPRILHCDFMQPYFGFRRDRADISRNHRSQSLTLLRVKQFEALNDEVGLAANRDRRSDDNERDIRSRR